MREKTGKGENERHESQNKTLGAHNKIGDLAKSATMEPAFKYNNWLRTVPLFVTAHTFCASRDIRVSQGINPPIQQYFCAV